MKKKIISLLPKDNTLLIFFHTFNFSKSWLMGTCLCNSKRSKKLPSDQNKGVKHYLIPFLPYVVLFFILWTINFEQSKRTEGNIGALRHYLQVMKNMRILDLSVGLMGIFLYHAGTVFTGVLWIINVNTYSLTSLIVNH